MSRPISIVCLLLVVLCLSDCTTQVTKTEISPDQQRGNAKAAQDELSTEVHR